MIRISYDQSPKDLATSLTPRKSKVKHNARAVPAKFRSKVADVAKDKVNC